MIFVTVGMQTPFDRLCKVVDSWCEKSKRSDVFMQVGQTEWTPSHCEFVKLLDADEFRDRMQRASVIVAHAGMGSILSAMQYRKPILVMPRKATLKETRNDHQLATCKQFTDMNGINVAVDGDALMSKLDTIDHISKPGSLAAHASPAMIEALRAFIAD